VGPRTKFNNLGFFVILCWSIKLSRFNNGWLYDWSWKLHCNLIMLCLCLTFLKKDSFLFFNLSTCMKFWKWGFSATTFCSFIGPNKASNRVLQIAIFTVRNDFLAFYFSLKYIGGPVKTHRPSLPHTPWQIPKLQWDTLPNNTWKTGVTCPPV